jgi:hypothetical protein
MKLYYKLSYLNSFKDHQLNKDNPNRVSHNKDNLQQEQTQWTLLEQVEEQ